MDKKPPYRSAAIKPLAKLTLPGLPDSNDALKNAAHEAFIKMSDGMFDGLAYQCRADLGMMLTVLDLVRMRCHFEAAGHVPVADLLRMVRETNENHLTQLELGLVTQEKEDAVVH